MQTHPQPRGSAIVQSMMVVVILSIIAVAVVRYGASETAGAGASAQQAALARCADAATRMLTSKFHLLGQGDPTSITVLNAALDGPVGKTRALGGHIDSVNVNVGQVTLVPGMTKGKAKGRSNVIDKDFMLNSTWKVTVHCQDGGDGTPTSGRQLEIEMGVRF